MRKLKVSPGSSQGAGAADAGFSDDTILRILHAGEAGLSVADLCSAENIQPRTYYLWKVKYGDLTPSELKRRRLFERWYRRAAVALACVLVLAIGYTTIAYLSGDSSGADARVSANVLPVSIGRRPARAPLVSPPAPSQAAAAVAPTSLSGSIAVQSPAVGPPATPVDSQLVAATEPSGYGVQVVAASTAQEAQRVVDRLAAAGYRAYLTRKTDGAGDVYRVRVGPVESRRAAEDLAGRLERDGYRSVWITK